MQQDKIIRDLDCVPPFASGAQIDKESRRRAIKLLEMLHKRDAKKVVIAHPECKNTWLVVSPAKARRIKKATKNGQ